MDAVTTPPAELAAAAFAGGTRRVVAPGGMGKTYLLDQVAEQLSDTHAVRWRAAIDPVPPDASDAILLADDVHLVDVEVVRELAWRPGGAVVAHRPCSGDVAAMLDAVDGSPLVLEPFSADDVRTMVEARTGRQSPSDLADILHAYTGGVPRFLLTAAIGEDSGPPGPTRALENAVHAELRRLSLAAVALLSVSSVLEGLDLSLLAETCDMDLAQAMPAAQELASAGLALDATGRLLPAVAEATRRSLPRSQLRITVDRAARLVMTGRGDLAAMAELARANGVGGPDAARCMLLAARRVQIRTPDRATALVAAASRCELAGADLAAVTTLINFHRGDARGTVAAADGLLTATAGRPTSSLGRDAAEAAAVVLARRGAWPQAAEMAMVAGPGSEGGMGLAVLGWIAIGDVGAARRAVGAIESANTAGVHGAAQLATAHGLLASVGDDPADALPQLLEATRLHDLAGTGGSRLGGPHALAALVACQLCEFEIATGVMTDLRGDVHRTGQRTRNLIAAWIAMRRGDGRSALTRAERARARTPAADDRITLTTLAVEAGVARRRGDLDAMLNAWRRARPVLLRVPPDLLLLQPIGELLIAGARLGDRSTVEVCLTAVHHLLARAGEPPLWTLWTRWDELHIAIALDKLDVARAAAKAAASLPWFGARTSALADAAVCWIDAMTGRPDPSRVRVVSRALADAGLVWEAARLAGGAAIRTPDSIQMRGLLQFARELSAPATPAPGNGSGVLSARELDVAGHLLAGLTYREIAGQLFIAPKTVEHHVARIRRRLGVESRSELLLALRRYVPSGSD